MGKSGNQSVNFICKTWFDSHFCRRPSEAAKTSSQARDCHQLSSWGVAALSAQTLPGAPHIEDHVFPSLARVRLQRIDHPPRQILFSVLRSVHVPDPPPSHMLMWARVRLRVCSPTRDVLSAQPLVTPSVPDSKLCIISSAKSGEQCRAACGARCFRPQRVFRSGIRQCARSSSLQCSPPRGPRPTRPS